MTDLSFQLDAGPATFRWHMSGDAEDVVPALDVLAAYLEDLRGMLTRDPETPLLVLASRVGALTETVGGLRNDIRTLSEHAPPAGAS